jgi:DNA replication protein DnaC
MTRKENNKYETARWQAIIVVPSRLPLVSQHTLRFRTYEETPDNAEAIQAARAFLAGDIDPPLLLVVGTPGVGKTHLALAVAWEHAEDWGQLLYYQAEELLDDLRDFEAGKYVRWIKRIRETPLLIIDDIGAQSDTAYGMAKMDMIIDYRYREHKPVLATSNTLKLPDRLLDRFKAGKVVLIKGQSRRGRKDND